MLTMQCVLDALRARKERFIFEENDIVLMPSVMAFITMNPGYPGRAELPESLKVLWPVVLGSFAGCFLSQAHVSSKSACATAALEGLPGT
jgi:hypothetical protein